MTARYRSADDRAIHTGTYFNGTIPPGTTVSRNDNCGQERECWDIIHNFPNVNPFESHSRWTIRARLSGEQWNAGHTILLRKLEAYPVDRVATARDPRSYYGSLDIPAIQQLMRDLLNQSSPSYAHVSVPTSIGELKDFGGVVKGLPVIFKQLANASFKKQLQGIPRLIQAMGNTLMGMAANGYISWRWAVKPMISDIRKMCQFVQVVDKRRRYLDRLANGETVRRRVGLSSNKTSVPQTEVFGSTGQGFSLKFLWSIDYSEKTWGTAKWKLSSASVPLPADDGTSYEAERLTYGITAFELLKTAWELTPWSWFADWFGDLGDQISLYNNQVPAYWADACVMRTIGSKANYTIKPGTMPSWCGLTQVTTEEWEIKERYNDIVLWLPLLPSTVPLLDSGKWSILSALAVSNYDRGLPGFFRRARR